MPLPRSMAGLRSKRTGEQFEAFFERVCVAQKIDCIRIPDGCRQIGAHKFQRVKTPFDYILAHNKKVCFVDLKVLTANKFPFSLIVPHQLRALEALGRHSNSGYLIYFKTERVFVFVHYSVLINLRPGSSINKDSGVIVGDILKQDFRKIFDSGVGSGEVDITDI